MLFRKFFLKILSLSRSKRVRFVICLDILIIIFSFYLSSWLTLSYNFTKEINYISLFLCLISVVISILIYVKSGQYRSLTRYIGSKSFYKMSLVNGEKFLLKTLFNLQNKILLNCKTLFLKSNGDLGAEAIIELVVVRKKNGSIKLLRELPSEINKILLLLEEGPKN